MIIQFCQVLLVNRLGIWRFVILEEPTTTIEPTTEQTTTGNRNIQYNRNFLPFSVSAI